MRAKNLVGPKLNVVLAIIMGVFGEIGAKSETVLSVTQQSYDVNLRIQCVVQRMDPNTFSAPSACAPGSPTATNPDRVTKNVYDAAGQLVQVRRAVGTSLEQAYVTYTYTLDSKREYVIDANGNKTKLTWDGFDRQIGWYFPSPERPQSFNPATQASALSSGGR